MQNRLKYLLVLSMLALIGTIVFQTEEKSVPIQVPPLQKVSKGTLLTKSLNNPILPKDSNREQLEDKMFLEITTNRYSEDLLIETTALIKELNNCAGLNYYDKKGKENFRFKFTNKQDKIISKALNDCQKLINQYPVMSKTINKLFNPTIKYLAPLVQSPYASLFMQYEKYQSMSIPEKREYKQKVAHFLVKSKNAQLILHLQDLITDYEIGDTFDLSYVLDTISIGYIGLIGFQATLLLSCEFNEGMTCLPTSVYMVNQCVNHEEACGKDLRTWFKLNNTPAHNRDIQKIVEYFKTL